MNVKVKEDNFIENLKTISTLIRIPKTEEEYNYMSDELFKIVRIVNGDRNHPLFPVMELLTIIVENYDDENTGINEPDGISMLKYFMEEFGLKQKDLQEEIGSQGVVSEILNGKRKLTREHIENLSRKFHVSPAVFF